MTGTSNSAGISPNVSRAKLYEAFGSALRLYIGRGKRHSYKEVERGAGVPARMIERGQVLVAMGRRAAA